MKRVLAICAIATVAVFSAVAPALALTSTDYWTGYIGPFGSQDGARHTLKYNVVSSGPPSYGQVCAGQLNSSGTWTGSYKCSTTGHSTTKEYCQCNLYYPRVHSSESFTQNLAGTSIW